MRKNCLLCSLLSLFMVGGCPPGTPPDGADPADHGIDSSPGSDDSTDAADDSDPTAEAKWGINAHLPDDRTLDAIKAAGITWVRYAADWSAIEPQQGLRFWDYVDQRVAAGRARDLQIVMTLTSTPDWAGTTGTRKTNDPPDSDAWAAFVTAAVTRYRGDIQYWGLWNEPNGGDQDYFAGTPEQYRDLILRPGAAAAKVVDPTCFIVAPGITIHTDWHEWMEPIFAEGGADVIDVVAVHLYVTGDADDWLFTIDARAGAWDDIWPLEKMLNELDASDKPVWIPEMSWCTGGAYAVSESEQAARLHGALWGVYQRDLIDCVFPYVMIDDSAGPQGTTLRPVA